MCPVIEITDKTFNELQSISVPLVDTPSTVIQRLLEVYKSTRGEQGTCVQGMIGDPTRSASDAVLQFNEGNLPDVTHTTFISGRAGAHSASDWNHLMLLAHAIAYECLEKNIDALMAASPANIKAGEVYANGFKYIKGYPFSVQGVEANKACFIALKLGAQFNFPMEANFRWQQKDRAAYPGRTGRICYGMGK